KDGHLLKYWDTNYKVVPLANKITNVFGQAHITFDGYVIDLFTAWEDSYRNYNTAQWGLLGFNNGFKDVYFQGTYFKMPCDYDEILTTLYGDWTITSNDHPSKRLKRKCYIK